MLDMDITRSSIPKIRLIIFFATEDGEALYSQQKQDRDMIVTQIMNSFFFFFLDVINNLFFFLYFFAFITEEGFLYLLAIL